MKKLLTVLLVVLMVTGMLSGCGKDDSATAVTSNDFVGQFASDLDDMDYVFTNQQPDTMHLANFVDGLLENDSLGNYVGALAETWETNADATVWTFHLREGAQWSTSTGEVYAEVTAQDFVTGLQHAADFDSQVITLVSGIITNLQAYIDGTITDFAEVGVKAVDDYTVEYTLSSSVPYFYTMATYNVLMPINQEFLESKGVGCKLGTPDVNACDFGAVSPDSILYNGGYILTTLTSKSVIEYTKNANYWDAEHVYINKVTLYYDDGSDLYSAIKGFEQGTYSAAILNASWSDYADYKTKYADYLTTVKRDESTTFFIHYNLNRTNYTNTSKTTQEEKDNTTTALQNQYFRLAVQAGFDRVSYQMQSMEETNAKATMRNMLTMPNFVTTSTGASYGSLVTKYFNEYDDAYGDIDLADGTDVYYSPEVCLAMIEKAKADGVSFPVTLDLPTLDTNARLVAQANSVKQSIEAASNGQILINVITMNSDDIDKYAFSVYGTPEMANYDINLYSGWGPDYVDPKTYVSIYNARNGDFLALLGLSNAGEDAASDAIAEKVGLTEYTALIDAADAIKSDLDARYDAYAKAEAFLLSKAIITPVSFRSVVVRVTKVVPYTAPYSVAGLGNEKYKFTIVQTDTVTTEQFEEAKAAWEAARS
ncbi:MAG: ABC transporter substrate-binding protein [Erysipelotrichaceae bacterium]|nr:ABC transporter substrate-binding protein [Erysipelotrichaceae bacterium]